MLVLYIFLPNLIETAIKKRLPAGFESINFNLQTIGIGNAFLTDLRISEGLKIDAVRADYTIKGLKDIAINRVVVSGLNIKGTIDRENKFKIPGLIPLKSNEDTAPLNPDLFLSYLPDKFVLKNSKIEVKINNIAVQIPFEALATIKRDESRLIVQTKAFPYGQEIRARAIINLENLTIQSIKISSDSFDSEHINPILSQFTEKVLLWGQTQFELESKSIQTAWKLSVSSIGLNTMMPVLIKNLGVHIQLDKEKIISKGGLSLKHSVYPTIPLSFESTTQIQKEFPSEISMTGQIKNNFKVSSDYGVILINGGELNFNYNGTINTGKGKMIIKANQGNIKQKDQVLGFNHFYFSSDSNIDFKNNDQFISSNVSLNVNKIKAKSKVGEASFPLLTAFGSIMIDKNNKPELSMNLKTVKGKIKLPDYKTELAGIQFELPIRYPFDGKNKLKRNPGKFRISKVSYQNKIHLGIIGKIIQTGSEKLSVQGDVKLKSSPDLKPMFSSEVEWKDGISINGNFSTNVFKLTHEEIEKYFPNKLQAAQISVNTAIKGEFKYKNNIPEIGAELNISDGDVNLSDSNLKISGINSLIKMKDLIHGRSEPGQVLTIDSIEINQIKMTDARIRFTIEDLETCLVDNIRLKWCKGLITSEAIRFKSGKKQYAVTLFCDRLDLARILKQMGAFHAEGSGTLNGRIPVIYSDGNIAFDNGFLFSTPGSGGNVAVQNSSKILAGIPMDSPQFSQLDLAQEALKDFDYKWAKLVFNTFEDTLYVNMELDGQPSKPLPFVFKKEFGGFARVDALNPGSNFQGIKLDVNLQLPLNEVMKFGNKLKSIFD